MIGRSVLRAASKGIRTQWRAFASVAPPKLFSYDEITANVKEKHAIESVEAAFGMLAKGKVSNVTLSHGHFVLQKTK